MFLQQSVLSYESSIFQRKDQTEPFWNYDLFNQRYYEWKLPETLSKYVKGDGYKIKWIGNDKISHILSFVYALLTGSLKKNSEARGSFLHLKEYLSHFMEESLSTKEQKICFEHLNFLQLSNNIPESIKKSNYLEYFLVKIFLTIKNNKFQAFPQMKNSIDEIKFFCCFFPFIQSEILDSKCMKLKIFDFQFFIIEEKFCYFIIEMEEKQKNMKYSNERQIDNLKSQKYQTRSLKNLKSHNVLNFGKKSFDNLNLKESIHLQEFEGQEKSNNSKTFCKNKRTEKDIQLFKGLNKALEQYQGGNEKLILVNEDNSIDKKLSDSEETEKIVFISNFTIGDQDCDTPTFREKKSPNH